MAFRHYGDDCGSMISDEEYITNVKRSTEWLRKNNGDKIADDFYNSQLQFHKRYVNKENKTWKDDLNENVRRNLASHLAVNLSLSIDES